METVKTYKCPCCGAGLVFDAQNQNLHCESCGNDFTIDTLEQLDAADNSASEAGSAYNWEKYTPRSFTNTGGLDLSQFRCPSCSAEIIGDQNMGASVCPYCGNPTIVKEQFEGTLQPDYIIPFKLDKKSAFAKFEEAYSRLPFLPDEFKNKNKINEMNGVYIPYFMFDCNCGADITYSGQTTSTWSDSKYDYIKTNYFRLYRQGNVGFKNVPADASKKADDAYTESVEPFDCREAVNFDPAYLSGYFAEKYDVSMDECVERANRRIKNTAERLMESTTAGYSCVTPLSSNIHFGDGKIRYALLPVWMLSVKYLDKVYRYAVNGQTGKTIGEFPVDKSKKSKFFWKVFGISFGVLAVLCAILILISGGTFAL